MRHSARLVTVPVRVLLAAVAGAWAAVAAPLPPVTSLAQLGRWAETNRAGSDLEYHLAGVLCTPSPADGGLLLQDASGAAWLAARWRHPALPAGQLVQVTGRTDGLTRLNTTELPPAKHPVPPPDLQLTGQTDPPPPRRWTAGWPLGGETAPQWAELEGEVAFWNRPSGSAGLELRLGGDRTELRLGTAEWTPPAYLEHGRLRARGLALPARTIQGTRLVGALWVPDPTTGLEPVAIPPAAWGAQAPRAISYLGRRQTAGGPPEPVLLQGEIRNVNGPHSLVLEDATGTATVETIGPAPAVGASHWEVLGRWAPDGPAGLVRDAVLREVPEPAGEAAGDLPWLTTAEEVQSLSREEARRAYPVRLRGVVGWVAAKHDSLIVQDATRGIYLRQTPPEAPLRPRIGEDWEFEGVSDPADFAPVVIVRHAVRHGAGQLPEPIRPSWDQLINGSLDAQYVEIQGVVAAPEAQAVTLLTAGGKLRVALPEFAPGILPAYRDAVVRLRGCLFADWSASTHQVRIARQIRLGNATLSVVEPPPANTFAAPRKHVGELLLFDPQAGALQRVRVAGPLLRTAGDTCWMLDGTNGLRFLPRDPVQFAPGDLVEVVGFPEWLGASPLLREAVARKTGQAPLPEPRRLLPANSLRGGYDATWVRAAGRLFVVRHTRLEHLLELQDGSGMFLARLPAAAGPLPALAPGTWVELTGVYAGQGGGRREGREIPSFELLLNSPRDLRIVSQPGWWTLGRLMAVVGVLAGVLVLAFIWITLLRREVDRRTAQLAAATRERQRAEQLRAVEGERARIARDLHDDLGGSLTEIGMLASSGPGRAFAPEQARERLGVIAGKARTLVHALDELVWAVNPQNDTLVSLAGYLAGYVDEFLSATGIPHRVLLPRPLPPVLLPAEVRHSLFLAVKEALSNAARHSGATEITFQLAAAEDRLELQIIDNGRGFANLSPSTGNGLGNLAERMRQLNGNCLLASRPGQGTVVTLRLPLPAPARP